MLMYHLAITFAVLWTRSKIYKSQSFEYDHVNVYLLLRLKANIKNILQKWIDLHIHEKLLHNLKWRLSLRKYEL